MGDEYGGDVRHVRVMQPTYSLVADEGELFDREIVERTLQPIVDKLLANESWSPHDAAPNKDIIHGMLEDLMAAVNELPLKRYKIILQATLGENKDQTVRVASQLVSDNGKDNTASLFFLNKQFWCSVVIIGMYAE